MRLRTQLLLVSLLTLALPWAGWRYTLAVERAQRADREAVLAENAALVERILSARLERLPDPLLETRGRDPRHELHAVDLTRPLLVDGFDDDWRDPDGTPPRRLADPADPGFALAFRAALGGQFFYLYVEVEDPDVRYRDPLRGDDVPNDQLVLIFDAPDGERAYVQVATAAPGPLTPQRLRDEAPLPRLRAAWRAAPGGFAVELRIPASMIGDRFGFAVLDARGDGWGAALGTLPAEAVMAEARPAAISAWRGVEPGLLIREAPAVRALLADLRREGQRLSVIDSAGWRIASAGTLALDPVVAADGTGEDGVGIGAGSGRADGGGRGGGRGGAVAGALLRAMLRREDARVPVLDVTAERPALPNLTAALAGEPSALRYVAADTAGTDLDARDTVVLSAAHPIEGRDGVVLGALLIEQSTDKFVTLTTPAFAGLMQATLLASLAAALGLLGYATVLSLRIGRLRNAAERAAEVVLRPGGRFEARMPLARAGDELGDLSRSFTALLGRLRQQTDYLQTLASKLSHELRTPLGIVQSSLDNLASGALPDDAAPYLERAAAGSARLRAILTAMSEATRLEQSLGSAEAETFDLAALLADMLHAYRDVYPQRQFELRIDPAAVPARLRGVPELIVQMLDKLVDNAVSFSPARGKVTLGLERQDAGGFALSVSNEGPPLPETMRERLFDSMVSVRERAPGAGAADGGGGGGTAAARSEEDRSPHLGLGLYIARLIAEFHGGSIDASDLDDGSGVVFTVSLSGR